MKRSTTALLASLASAFLLTACGGGSSIADAISGRTSNGGTADLATNDPAKPDPIVFSSPAGAYEGTISNGKFHRTIILNSIQFYTLYGTESNGSLTVEGFLQANGGAFSGSMSATEMDDYLADGSVVRASMNGTYRDNAAIQGTVTEGAQTVTFTGAPISKAVYNYDTPANPANVVGAWKMTSVQGASVTLNIQNNGSISGSSDGCSFSGTIVPRGTINNVFDTRITFGAPPCAMPGKTVAGAGIEYLLTSGKRELIIAGVTDDRKFGTALIGQR